MSAFKIMWVLVMFDLPTKTKKDRKKYQWFSKLLAKEHYIRLQYSVYAKVFNTPESAELGKKRVREFISINIKKGNIRLMAFTDKQFAKMELITGEVTQEEDNAPKQLLLF